MPNAGVVQNSFRSEVRALQDIEAGEEILINYVDPLATSAERKQDIKERYSDRIGTSDKPFYKWNEEFKEQGRIHDSISRVRWAGATRFIFYQNHVYKNVEAQIPLKLKNIVVILLVAISISFEPQGEI